MRPLGPDCTIRTRFHEPLLVPNEKRLVHGGWDCAEVYSRFNNASAGANKDYGLPTTWFLAHTFHGLTIQISDKINLPYSFSTLTTQLLGTVFPHGEHDFECLRSPARLARYDGQHRTRGYS